MCITGILESYGKILNALEAFKTSASASASAMNHKNFNRSSDVLLNTKAMAEPMVFGFFTATDSPT